MKRKLSFLIPLIFIVLSTISVTYALYITSLGGENYAHVLEIGDFLFKMNGHTYEYNETADIEAFTLSRGETRNLDLSFEVEGGSNGAISYTFGMTTDDADINSYKAFDIFISDYQTGIVYSDGTLYDYLKEDSPKTFSGILASGEVENYLVSIVYSLASSDYYEDKELNFTFYSVPQIASSQDLDFHYVTTEQELALKLFDGSGKKVKLASDIEFNGVGDNKTDLIGADLFSIDLNGHNLTLNKNIILTTTMDEESNPDYHFGIYDSKLTGSINGNGNIIINISSEGDYAFIPVANNITSNVVISGVTANGIKNYIQYEIDNLAKKIYFKDSIFDLSQNISYYNPTLTLSSDTMLTFRETDTANIYTNFVKKEYTRVDFFEVDVNYNGHVSSLAKTGFTIRGNGTSEIFKYYMEMIPENIYGYIDASIYLPGYDQATGAKLTWKSSDENIMSSDGVILPNGITSDLENYLDKTIKMGLILEIDGTLRDIKTLKIEIMSGEERFHNLYSFSSINITSESKENEFYSILDYFIRNENLEFDSKYGVESIELIIPESEVNVNYTDGDEVHYFVNVDEDNKYLFKVNSMPENGRNKLIPVKIRVNYLDDKSYTYDTNIALIGKSADNQVYDASGDLQSSIDRNTTLTTGGYFFNTIATVSTGGFVKYRVRNEYKSFLSTSEYHWINYDGENLDQYNYLKIDEDDYLFINKLYKKVDEEYVLADKSYIGTVYITDGTNYYEVSDANRYKYEAVFVVNKDKLPPKNVIAMVDAYIYPTYEDFKNETNSDQAYTLTLSIEGCYHNNDSEIKDTVLYNELVRLFDQNNDGFISISEALAENKGVNLTGKGVSSLKGLEYFVNLEKLNISGSNSFNDISYIENLRNLDEINFSGNQNVKNILAVQYLDKLETLNLSGCDISSLEPLRYLKSIRNLNLTGNSKINDVEPLSTNITTLVTVRMDIGNSNITPSGPSTMHILYYYQRMMQNCNYGITELVLNKDNTLIQPGTTNSISQGSFNDYRAGALSTIVVAPEVKDTLNLPLKITYQGKEYSVIWTASDLSSTAPITFVHEEINNTAISTRSYTINSIDEDMTSTIRAQLYTDENGAVSLGVMRLFEIKFLTHDSSFDNIRIQIEDGGDYLDPFCDEVGFEDINLVRKIAKIFDINGNGIIEYSEIHNSEITRVDLSNLNIFSINGLRFFKEIEELDLRGNVFDTDSAGYVSLAELSELNLTKLLLDENMFDYSTLASVTYDHETKTLTRSGLTSLKELDIRGSIGLSEEKTLKNLYEIYLACSNQSTTITIKIDSDNAWNPYQNITKTIVSYLPTMYTVKWNSDFINVYKTALEAASISISSGNVSYTNPTKNDNNLSSLARYEDNKYYFEYDLYGYPIIFTVSSITIDKLKNQFQSNGENGKAILGVRDNTYIYISQYYYTDIFFYPEIKLLGKDVLDKQVDNPDNVKYRLSVLVENNRDLEIKNNTTNDILDFELNDYKNVTETFTGRDIRWAILKLNKFADVKDGHATLSLNDAINSTTSFTAFAGGYDAFGLNPGALNGLQYLTKLTVINASREMDVKDGSTISNIGDITLQFSTPDLSKVRTDITKLTKMTLYNNFGVNFYNQGYKINKNTIFPDQSHTIKNAILQKFGDRDEVTITEYINFIMEKYLELYSALSDSEKENWTSTQDMDYLFNEAVRLTELMEDGKYIFYLKYLPNIKELYLSLGVSDLGNYIDDFGFLLPLITNNNISNLRTASSTASNKYPNTNVLSIPSIGIYTMMLYNRPTITIYAGTLASPTSSTKFVPKSAFSVGQKNDLYEIEINDEDEVEYYKKKVLGLSVAIDVTSQGTGTDNRLKLHDLSTNQTVQNGNYIFLPKYATFYLSKIDDDEYRKIEISWSIYTSSAVLPFSGATVAGTQGSYSERVLTFTAPVSEININSNIYEGYYLQVNSPYDYYCYLRGTFGGYTSIDFIYPILCLGSSYYTGPVNDMAGKTMFESTGASGSYPYFNKIDTSICMSYRAIKEISDRFHMFMALTSGNSTFNTGDYSKSGTIYFTNTGMIGNLGFPGIERFAISASSNATITIKHSTASSSYDYKTNNYEDMCGTGIWDDLSYLKYILCAYTSTSVNTKTYTFQIGHAKISNLNFLVDRRVMQDNLNGALAVSSSKTVNVLSNYQHYRFYDLPISDVSELATAFAGVKLNLTLDQLSLTNVTHNALPSSTNYLILEKNELDLTNFDNLVANISGGNQIELDDNSMMTEPIIKRTVSNQRLSNNYLYSIYNKFTNFKINGTSVSQSSISTALNKFYSIPSDHWNTNYYANRMQLANFDSNHSYELNNVTVKYLDNKITNHNYGTILTLVEMTYDGVSLYANLGIQNGFAENTSIYDGNNENQVVDSYKFDSSIYTYLWEQQNRTYYTNGTLDLGLFPTIKTLNNLHTIAGLKTLIITGDYLFDEPNSWYTQNDKKFNDVTSLTIRNCHLTEYYVACLIKCCPNLKRLDLSNMKLDFSANNWELAKAIPTNLEYFSYNSYYTHYNLYDENEMINCFGTLNSTNRCFKDYGPVNSVCIDSNLSNYNFKSLNRLVKYVKFHGMSISSVLSSVNANDSGTEYILDKISSSDYRKKFTSDADDLLFNNTDNYPANLKQKVLDEFNNGSTSATGKITFYKTDVLDGDIVNDFEYVYEIINHLNIWDNSYNVVWSGDAVTNGLLTVDGKLVFNGDVFKALKITANKTYTATATVADAKYTLSIEIDVDSSEPQPVAQSYITDYYIELPVDDVIANNQLKGYDANYVALTKVVDGKQLALYSVYDIFKSSRLIYHIFGYSIVAPTDGVQDDGVTNYNSSNFSYKWRNPESNAYTISTITSNPKLANAVKYSYGYGNRFYLSYSEVLKVKYINTGKSPIKGNSTNTGMTANEGLQYFKNTVYFSMYAGNAMDYDVLKDFKLTTFESEIGVNNQYNQVRIDFDFLDNSKDTLQELTLNFSETATTGLQNSPFIDPSFIFKFKNLKTANIFKDTTNAYWLKTRSAKYFFSVIENEELLGQIFNNCKIKTGFKINVCGQTMVQCFDWGVQIQTWNINGILGNVELTEAELNAAKILYSIQGKTNNYPVNMTSDFEYIDNCTLVAEVGKSSYVLPSFIMASNGSRYQINYVSGSDNLILNYSENEFDYDSSGTWSVTYNESKLAHEFIVAKICVNNIVYERIIYVDFI